MQNEATSIIGLDGLALPKRKVKREQAKEWRLRCLFTLDGPKCLIN